MRIKGLLLIWRAHWIALLIGLAFTAPALAQTPAGPDGITVTDAIGTVSFRIGEGQPQKLVKGQTIPLGARIATESASYAVLTFPDGQIVALGTKSRLVIREFRYLPKDIDRSGVVLNLTDGSARIVMGAIGQHDPGLIQLQIGSKTTAQTPNLPGKGDLGMVMLGSATVIQVNQGRVALSVAGETYPLATGESVHVQADGFVQLGGPAQLEKQLGRTADDKAMFAQFQEMQEFAFAKSPVQTMITLATPPYDEKRMLESLPPPSEISPLLTTTPSTLATGAGGGGLPCGASCN